MILECNDSDGAGIANNLINRVCLSVFLFVFNALLFYWIDTVHTTVNVAFAKEAFKGSLDYEFITPMGRLFFWIVTGLVICLTVCFFFFFPPRLVCVFSYVLVVHLR